MSLTAAAPHVVLDVRDLTRDFGAVRALDGLSFGVRSGEVVGLLGHNGAGKTTTIRVEYQFATLFLIVPLMVASVIAADSFAGEKERKTLESLLYTPTTDLELCVAKLLGPWLAAMGVAVVGFVLYAVAVSFAAASDAGRLLALTPLWLLVIGWLSPAVAAVGLGVMVIVSARVRGFQEAYQLGGAIVVPVVLLIVAQVAGILFIDALLALALGLIVWIVAAGVLWLGYRGFRRERLLLS